MLKKARLHPNFLERRKAGVRRKTLLRGWVTKDHQPGFGLLVDDEYSRAEPAHRSLDTALGLQISWPVLRELLVGVGKLAGRELFAGAGLHYYASRHPTSARERAAVRAHHLSRPLSYRVALDHGAWP